MDDEHDDGDDKYCDESVRTVIMIIVTMIWMMNMMMGMISIVMRV